MVKLYLKYSILFIALIISMVYFFFIDTGYKQENLLPFFILVSIISIGLYLLFKSEKRQRTKS